MGVTSTWTPIDVRLKHLTNKEFARFAREVRAIEGLDDGSGMQRLTIDRDRKRVRYVGSIEGDMTPFEDLLVAVSHQLEDGQNCTIDIRSDSKSFVSQSWPTTYEVCQNSVIERQFFSLPYREIDLARERSMKASERSAELEFLRRHATAVARHLDVVKEQIAMYEGALQRGALAGRAGATP